MGQREELMNVPGLEESDRVVIKKLGYGTLNKLRSKSTDAEINATTGKISAKLDLGEYMKYMIIFGIEDAPFFKGLTSVEQRSAAFDNDVISSETGEYLFKEIKRFNNFDGVEELKKK